MEQITIPIAKAWNFTPASLMNYYAKQTPGVTFYRTHYGKPWLILKGNVYQYHHWSIATRNGVTFVTMFLDIVTT